MTVLQWFPMFNPLTAFDLPIIKDVTEDRQSTTTRTDDAELFVALESGKTYLIEGQVFFRSNASADFKYNLQLTSGDIAFVAGFNGTGSETVPGTAFVYNRAPWTPAMTDPAFVDVVAGQSDATRRGILNFSFVITIGATGGNFAVSWAALANVAQECIVYENSWMRTREVET
jgi:hypothetical protein